jgi:uncharacterized protein YkwD
VNPWECAERGAFEDETLRLINYYRVVNNRRALIPWEAFRLAEREWADYMVATEQCYHGDYPERAARYGYPFFTFGENGACGYESPQAVLQGWIDSPGHNGLLLADRPFDILMTDGGVGCTQYASRRWSCWFLIGGDSIWSPTTPQRYPSLAPVVNQRE